MVRKNHSAKRKTEVATRGRPSYAPTAEQKERVEVLIGGGMSEEEISAALGISRSTLRKQFAKELSCGRSKKRAEVLEAMFNSARAGNVSAQKAYVALNALATAEDVVMSSKPAPGSTVDRLGKKQIAEIEAARAADGTDWGGDLDPTVTVQ